MASNAWDESSDEDEYLNNDIELNETPPPDIDVNFKQNILKIKHSLYDNTVLSPELGTKKVHDNRILNTYINQLNGIYIMIMKIQNGQKISQDLTQYPEGTRELIKATLNWIGDFFRKNRVEDTIPYFQFVQTHLHEYPFNQSNSFDAE